MINYTKRNVSFLSFVLALTLFVSFCIIYSYFQNSKEKNPDNNLYTRVISNYSIKVPNYYNENSENNTQNDFLLKNKLNVALLNPSENTLKLSTKLLEKSNKNSTNTLTQNTTNIENINQNNTNNANESSKEFNTNQTTLEENNLQSNSSQEPNLEQNTNEKTQTQVLEENKEKTWRIQIPKINLDAHISEGITSSVLLTSIGHFEETSKWQGNVGLAAHNRGYKCNFFQDIKNLEIGDEIIYTTANNKRVYKVQTNKVILQTDWSYLQSTKDNRITLITCEENRKDYRRCVQAVEVANNIIK